MADRETREACEWDPARDEPAEEGAPWHGEAVWSVGVADNLHLCEACAALPRFRRRRHRVRLRQLVDTSYEGQQIGADLMSVFEFAAMMREKSPRGEA